MARTDHVDIFSIRPTNESTHIARAHDVVYIVKKRAGTFKFREATRWPSFFGNFETHTSLRVSAKKYVSCGQIDRRCVSMCIKYACRSIDQSRATPRVRNKFRSGWRFGERCRGALLFLLVIRVTVIVSAEAPPVLPRKYWTFLSTMKQGCVCYCIICGIGEQKIGELSSVSPSFGEVQFCKKEIILKRIVSGPWGRKLDNS